MAEATLQHQTAAVHGSAGEYEAPLFGAYSKKVGMWLFLASDSLTFGALLFAFSYNRIYTVVADAVWQGKHYQRDDDDGLPVVELADHGAGGVGGEAWRSRVDTKLDSGTMVFGTAFIVLHGMEWTHLIREGLTLPGFPKSVEVGSGEYAEVAAGVPQFAATFFGLTAMHMLHVTIGVIYLGVVALRKWFLPILGALWLAGVFLIPADNVFHYGIHVLLIGLVVASVILFLKPKDYDADDVEVSGLYWHFVDLVWMFIFPLVYLMSTKV